VMSNSVKIPGLPEMTEFHIDWPMPSQETGCRVDEIYNATMAAKWVGVSENDWYCIGAVFACETRMDCTIQLGTQLISCAADIEQVRVVKVGAAHIVTAVIDLFNFKALPA